MEGNQQAVYIKTIGDSMRCQGLAAKATRKFKITTDSNHKLPVTPNLFERDFTATAPNQKLYLFMGQRRLALFSRYYRPVFKSGNWLVYESQDESRARV